MTNFIKKIIAAATLGLALVTVAPAMAAECSPGRDWAAATEQLKELNTKVVQMNDELIKTMVDKIGTPPHSEGNPFDAYLVTQGEISAVFIIQNGCIIDRLGPANTETLNKVLGITES